MKARSCYGSTKIRLTLTLLIGALSASAIAFGDTILAPVGFAHEGSSLATLDPEVQVVGNPKRLRPGKLPGLTSPSMFVFQTTVDDGGPDDEPGQKDLNLMAVDFGAAGATTFLVRWNWDNTATSGNNTRDGGALFDTDGDGNANYSLYITVNTNGTYVTQLYVCTADSRADRCGGPNLDTSFASTATVAVEANSDPFRDTALFPSHSTGNTCSNRPGCYTADTVANVNADLNDFGNPEDIVMLNVCSYPSGEPNSDPSDCVVEEAPGYLTLVKVVNNFGESGSGYKTVADFPLTIDGTSTTSGTEVSVVAGSHTIAETSQTGYTVGTWTCSNGTSGTAGSVSATVTIASGDDVTCTMTNTLIANRSLTIDKTANPTTYDSVGDVINYTITVTNTGNVTLTNVTVSDPGVAGLSCTPANGSSLAPLGVMTCTASHTITQADLDNGTYLNTACADDGAGGAAQVCDPETVTGDQTRRLSLVKTARIKTITYSFVITNTGNVTLSTVGLTDPLFVSGPNPTGLVNGCTSSSLAPGGTAVCEADYTVTAQDYINGYVTNIATATAAGGVLRTATVTITPLTVVSPTPTP